MKNLVFNIKSYIIKNFSNHYRKYIELKNNTCSELWNMDGERNFTEKEMFFNKVFEKYNK